jgi:hypothetical protein
MKKLITLFSLALLGFNMDIKAQCNDLSTQYNHGFENAIENAKWNILDNNSDGDTWEVYGSQTHSNSGDSSLKYTYSFSNNADDWAFTPCLDLKASDTYNVGLFLKAYSSGYPEKMRVLLTQGTATNTVIDTLIDEGNIDWETYQARSSNFNVPTDGIYYIAFECYSISGQWNLYIDDINIRKVIPNDAAAIKLSSSASDACDISPTESISIDFVNFGSNPITSIDLSYSINSGTAVNETYTPSSAITSGDTASYTFTTTADLSTDGNYSIIGTVNLTGDADASNNTTSALNIKNLAPVSTPYLLDFDTITDGSTGPNLDGVFFTSTGDFLWTIESGSTSSSSTGPSGDASGTGNYIYTEATYGSSGDTAELKSQCIDLGSMANPTLTFNYHMYGDSMGDLHVMISTNGINFVTLESIIGQQDTSETDIWNIKKIDLISYSGQTIYLNFVAIRGGSYTSDIALDDISVNNSYDNDLKLLSASTADSDCGLGNEEVSVEIYNNGKNTVTSFDIAFSVDGGTPISETYSGSLVKDASMSYTFANKADLSAPGDHDIEVILNFSNDEDAKNDSAWTEASNYGPHDLTLSDYEMGFELDDANDLEKLNKWSLHDLNADGSSWSAYYDVNTATNDTNYSMGYQYDYTNNADDWLISSCIDMRAGATYEVSIKSYVNDLSWGVERLIVMMGTDNDPSSMTDTIIDISSELDTTIITFADTFTAPISQSYYLGIKAASEANIWYLFVDDAKITQLTESTINEKGLTSFSLYPNPTNGFVTLDLSNIRADIHISNIEGQITRSIFNSNGLVKINTDKMNPGIYFVQVENENTNHIQKLIVY